MRIMKTPCRRTAGQYFWTVDGVASCGTVEEAVELAFDAQGDIAKSAQAATLWTVYGKAA